MWQRQKLRQSNHDFSRPRRHSKSYLVKATGQEILIRTIGDSKKMRIKALVSDTVVLTGCLEVIDGQRLERVHGKQNVSNVCLVSRRYNVHREHDIGFPHEL